MFITSGTYMSGSLFNDSSGYASAVLEGEEDSPHAAGLTAPLGEGAGN